jgi:hypothetical protein
MFRPPRKPPRGRWLDALSQIDKCLLDYPFISHFPVRVGCIAEYSHLLAHKHGRRKERNRDLVVSGNKIKGYR